MNKFIGIGRLTDDPQTYGVLTKDEKKIVRYSIAIPRMKEGADFLNCVAFGKPAEFAEKYLRKGTKVAIIGHVQTGSYTNKDGQKVNTTDIVIESQEFCEKKQEESGRFTEVPEGFNPFE